ncbi:MAG TPA: exodeoxyribonuclease VII large subunit [Vicinamibacterales bacterium]|nr:exodeoxyribonuclease VII large subunit [Vicinamibacterales bacterium]
MPEVLEVPKVPEALQAKAAAPVRTVLTVSELNATIRDLLENALVNVWVEGELSNARVWNTGHMYFTLKDGASQVKGVMFRSALRYLKFKPEDGIKVVARGKISVYDPKGEYQIICEHLEPKGVGALQQAFEQLKKKLQAEGLFDQARKRPLPVLPRRIGIVTSMDGAALRDIVRVLRRRYPNAHLVLSPTRVQGEGAGREVAHAIRKVARIESVDVVIVARGGGSLEDLWAFNEEVLARVIAESAVPIISGVGHETDFTIADFVADLRAPTPSAAAELVVGRKDEFFARIGRICERLDAAMHHRLRRMELRLHTLEARPGYAGFEGRIAVRGRHVSELAAALRQRASADVSRRVRRHEVLRRSLDQFDPRHRLAAVRTRLVSRDGQLQAAVQRRITVAQSRLGALAARIDGLSPLAVLGRGYSVTWDATRTRIIRDASTVKPGDRISVTLERGTLDATVEKASGETERRKTIES